MAYLKYRMFFGLGLYSTTLTSESEVCEPVTYGSMEIRLKLALPGAVRGSASANNQSTTDALCLYFGRLEIISLLTFFGASDYDNPYYIRFMICLRILGHLSIISSVQSLLVLFLLALTVWITGRLNYSP